MKNLEKTDLRDNLQGNLLKWNTSFSDKFDLSIDELRAYGKKLTAEGVVSKGDSLLLLVNELENKGNMRKKRPEYLVPWKTNLVNLQFKMNLVQTLHSKDETLNEYRGLARLIANMLSLLLCLGIPNFINLATSGNFLFFNKVKSQDLVRQAEQSLLCGT